MPSELRFDEHWIRAFEASWRIPGRCAADWLRAVRADPEHLAGIFPGLVADECADLMLDVWLEFGDAGDRCERAARKLLGRAAGMDWVWAFNLMRLCLRGWLFVNGTLLRQGVDASQMSLSDWLMAAYTLIYEGKDETGRLALESELSTPPAGVRLVIPAAIQHRAALAFALD